MDLEKFLQFLQDSRTTPEKALESLVSSYSSPVVPGSSSEDRNSCFQIFLASLRFVIERQPIIYLSDIWEDILWMSLKNSKHIDVDYLRAIDVEIFNEVRTWLSTVLSDHRKCPNPYLRLEIFRLGRLFGLSWVLNSESRIFICLTFKHTICDIQPHRLYPVGDASDILFGAIDLNHVIACCCRPHNLTVEISRDISDQKEDMNLVFPNRNGELFISHCVRLIGVFANIAGINTDIKNKFTELKYCLIAFRENIGLLVYCEYLQPGITRWQQFKLVISSSPLFRRNVVEVVQNMTASIANYESGTVKEILMSLRDIIAEEMEVCTTPDILPKLILLRQYQLTTKVQQSSFLLQNLAQSYEIDSNTDEDDIVIEFRSKRSRWSIIMEHLCNVTEPRSM